MKKLLLAICLTLATSQTVAQQSINEYVAKLADQVLLLRSRVESLEKTVESERRAARENYAQLRAFLLDFSCKHNNLLEGVSNGTKQAPVFSTQIDVIYGRDCVDQSKPAPVLHSGY